MNPFRTIGLVALLLATLVPPAIAQTPALWREEQLAAMDKSDAIMQRAHQEKDLLAQYQVLRHAYASDGRPAFRAIFGQYLSWYRRRASTEVPRAEAPDRPDPRSLADRVVEQDEMWSMLATLPRMQRAVLVLRYYEDIPDAEIGELLGCTTATVRVHAFKALKRLRAALSIIQNELVEQVPRAEVLNDAH